MRIELKAKNQLTDQDRLGLDRLSAEAFPLDGDNTQWAVSDWHVLVWEDDKIVSHVEIVERTATVGSCPICLGGIGGVATLKNWRKHGLAEVALKVAVNYLHQPLAVDFGLLVCSERMIPYYSKFGWRLISRPMWIDQPQGRVLYTAPIMILPVGKDKWPDGDIDLCGQPW